MVSARMPLEKKCDILARIAIAEAMAVLQEEGTPNHLAGLGFYLSPTPLPKDRVDAWAFLMRLSRVICPIGDDPCRTSPGPGPPS